MMRQHRTKKTNCLWLCIGIGLTLCFPANARQLIKTGLAFQPTQGRSLSPGSLRQRATRDAMEQALREVNGEELSVERASLDYSRSSFQTAGDAVKEQVKERSAFHSNARTRLRGMVRLLDVLQEEHDAQRYKITLKMDVQSEQEMLDSITPGSLWRQIGSPGLSLVMEADRNGGGWWPADSFARYIQQQLAHNDLALNEQGESRYRIRVSQSLENQYLPEYGTWKSLCELGFTIRDNETGLSRYSEHLRGGPAAGFSEKEAADNCLHKTSVSFSRKLMEKLSLLFQEEWLNGRSYHISIGQLPGTQAPQARRVIGNLLGSSSTEHSTYRQQTLNLTLAYKGQPLELAEAIMLALDESGMRVDFDQLQGNQLSFTWKETSD